MLGQFCLKDGLFDPVSHTLPMEVWMYFFFLDVQRNLSLLSLLYRVCLYSKKIEKGSANDLPSRRESGLPKPRCRDDRKHQLTLLRDATGAVLSPSNVAQQYDRDGSVLSRNGRRASQDNQVQRD